MTRWVTNSFPRRLTGYYSQVASILFCKWKVQGTLLGLTPYILTAVTIRLCQSQQAHARLVLQFIPWLLLPHPLIIIPSLDITASAVHHSDHKWINKPKVLWSLRVLHEEQFKFLYLTSQFGARWHDYLGCQWNSLSLWSLASNNIKFFPSYVNYFFEISQYKILHKVHV
jgi:hypothetical protein